MIIRDVMPAFELHQPTQLRDAFALLDRFGKDAWKMAGGYDSLSWFKERVKRPKAVIDLSGIAEMKGVKETPDGGVEIGALEAAQGVGRRAHDGFAADVERGIDHHRAAGERIKFPQDGVEKRVLG